MKQSDNQTDKQSDNQKKNDFSRGSVVGNIMKLAVPMTLAQLINVLYNIVDRIYIGTIPENATLSLTGLGLCLPIISIVIAFANLFGMGGAPLCSIERGRGNEKEAEAIMGNSFVMMVAVGILLTVLGLMFKRPMLYLFGASDATIPYADAYVTIYLMGNIFVMTGLGMNSFINSQGFGTVGMMTVLLGAVTNIVLDPVFIFVFHMGVRGAALATILSQMLSALWILAFLTGRRTILKLRPSAMKLDAGRLLRIVGLGMSGFTMSITNSLVQIMYNSMLQKFGGDLYVGIMTVINSVREVISMPVNGLTNSAQPVLGYNYGAREYKRVQKAIVFMSVVCILYTVVAWGFVDWFPAFFIRIFNRGGRHGGGGNSGYTHVFLWIFHDVPSVCGPVRVCGSGEIQKRGIFFHFPQGYHCHTPYHHTAHCIRNGNPGHTDGRAHIQLHRRSRLLRDHAAHCVA